MPRGAAVPLALLCAGVAALYAPGLTYSPPYLHEAEVLFGLHAHAIATSAHDLHGRFMPLYFQMPPIGENVWFHPAVVYATALFLKVLPFTEWAIRLPSIVVAATNVALLFLIARRLFGTTRLATTAAMGLALAPAHFVNSRIAMDYVYPLPFVLGWLLLLLVYLERPRPRVLVAAGSVLGLGVYSYIASVVMMPLYLAVTWLVLFFHDERPFGRSLLVAVGFAWPLLILPVWLYFHPAVIGETLTRYGVPEVEQVTSFSGKSIAEVLAELRRPLRFSGLTGRVSLYWDFFDPAYLFVTGGYANVVNSTRHVGVFVLPFVLLVPLGAWRVLAARRSMDVVVIAGFLTAPVAACLVVPEPYAIDREMAVVPFGVLLAVYGLAWLLDRGAWHRRAALTLAAVGVAHFCVFLVDYYGDYRGRAAFWFNKNHRAALAEIVSQAARSPVPAFYLNRRGDPYIDPYWRFTLTKFGREDWLHRTVYFDGESLDPSTIPPASLILGIADDRRLTAEVERGTLQRVATIPEPADPPYFAVYRRR
jgi:4-amino-4-deoxy-L-arabinose transferase-like glycosyltransferase